MRNRPRRIGPALAFALGFVVALPFVARPSLLGPTCSRTGGAGAYLTLKVVSATRDGVAVTPPADFTAYIQSISADATRLHAVLLDVGDSPASTPTFPDKTILRVP